MDIIYDSEKINSLLNNFYTITKIKIVLFDNQFNCIATAPSGDSEFCAALSCIKTASSKCSVCTQNAITSCKKDGLNLYRCHAGLTEAVMPIRINDIIVGYIMLGQILKTPCDEADAIIKYATEYLGGDAEKHFKRIIRKSEKEIESAVKLMESCVCYLLMNKVIQEQHGNTVFLIKKYIDENINDQLTTKKLCQEFNISRNRLYYISNTYYGMPIAKYINYRRVERAKALIRSGISVADVADMIGFGDYGYFGKIFKRFTGYTPTQEKKQR